MAKPLRGPGRGYEGQPGDPWPLLPDAAARASRDVCSVPTREVVRFGVLQVLGTCGLRKRLIAGWVYVCPAHDWLDVRPSAKGSE